MILGKYITPNGEEKQNRGYSVTSKVQNDVEEVFFAKWLKGIKKDSRQSKILFDKLRHFKKAVHPNLAKIIEYNWDENEGAYCIIFENINAKPLEVIALDIEPTFFLKGIAGVVNCLKSLLKEFRLTHGDITPANILVDETLNFYLIDFGLSDITATLSQEADIEIFAKEFAAPEKWDRNIPKSFPYKSDIFSVGKVVEWYFNQKDLLEFEEIKRVIDQSCNQDPEQRIDYSSLLDKISKITKDVSFENENIVYVENATEKFLGELNDKQITPRFDIIPNPGENILLDIVTKSYVVHCMWIIDEKKLLVRNCNPKEEDLKKYKNTAKYSKDLGLPLVYKSNIYYGEEKFNLGISFRKIQQEKQQKGEYRKAKRMVSDELAFYKELLEKELKVLEENSLRLRYVNFKKKGELEVSFRIRKNEKYSTDSLITQHIDKATPPKPEDFEYYLSPTADKKQIKVPLKLVGIAYDFDSKERILKFKDCEGLDFEKIPKHGYIFENISRKEEEKKRQLEAIRKVEYGDVQNRDLIHYLFNPAELKGIYINQYDLDGIYQSDKKGNPFKYSDNQQRAIINALHREPLTVIQGPPGTGKTTVITEIVLQILNKKPDAKILITSQTNNAVDNVLENLLEKQIPIIRLSGIRQPKSNLRKHTLERKIEGWKRDVKRKAEKNWNFIEKQFREELEEESILLPSILKIILSNKKWKTKKQQIEKICDRFKYDALQESLNNQEDLISAIDKTINLEIQQFFEKRQIHKDWIVSISSLDEKSTINQKLVDSIRVIGATTNHIAAKKYKKYNFEFDYVIMDESGKATIAESLVPIVFAERLVLVGDHRQLRPMLTSNKEVEKWLRNKHKKEASDLDGWDDYFNRASLFEKVIEEIDADFTSQLEVCRRSSKDQVILTSKCFYEPFGDEPIKPFDRLPIMEHNLDLKVESSIIFIDTGNANKSETDRVSRSSYNIESAKMIPELLLALDDLDKVKDYSIGIITGYSAQVRMIKKEIGKKVQYRKLKNIKRRNNNGEDNILISVVDKFQGLENDIVIFDLVKSNDRNLGFLANPNRINVALSRQKKLLIIIGNLQWLLFAKAPGSKYKDGKTALQNYLREIKPNWIVNSIEQIF